MSTQYNINLNQGALYTLKINLVGKDINGTTAPFDLTNYEVRSQFRKSFDTCESVNFTITVDDVLLGKITLTLGASVSVDVDSGSYVWDLEVYDPNDADIVYRPLYGTVTVTPEVTK